MLADHPTETDRRELSARIMAIAIVRAELEQAERVSARELVTA